MRRLTLKIIAMLTALILAACALPRSAQALTVFDPANFQQNLLSAVRALEQINNQIRQLQNQAQMILQMDKNLQCLTGTVAPDLSRTLSQIQTRLNQGNAIALNLKDTEAALDKLFPGAVPESLAGEDVLRNARERWSEAHASFERSARIQAEIIAAVAEDDAQLTALLRRSEGAEGSLQAMQAGNELSALAIKQALQLQTLLAAEARAASIERARSLMGEAEARQRFQAFLGNGSAYSRQ